MPASPGNISGEIMNAARETADIAIRKSGTVQPRTLPDILV
jgi:hypothetical protein